MTRSILTMLVFVGVGWLQPSFVLAQNESSAALFANAINQTEAKLQQDPYAQSSAHARRLTSEFIAGLVNSSWQLSYSARHLNYPAFSSGDEFVGLPGLYNPDNIYRSALLEDSASYRISGTRGSHNQLTFQFVDSYPLVGLSRDLLVIDLQDHGINPGDKFELVLGGPQREGLWWPMPKGAKAVLTRQTFNDWARETPSELHIERLNPGRQLPSPIDRLQLAAQFLQQATALWADRYLAMLRRLPVNTLPPMQASTENDGGLSGQHTVMARFSIKPDQALIVTSRLSDAAYQGMQLGDYWFVTPNPVMHQSSLNLSQAQVSRDGKVRYVISLQDPGVANWLDPAGSGDGYLLLRWQGIKTPLTKADQPLAELVDLQRLRDYLPTDSLLVDDMQRAQQLVQRRAFPSLK